MDTETKKLLNEAKAHFYSWRLHEAYHGFRRYFDRLPFKPEAEHGEYIGYFVRTLVELGKEYELKFYVQELEKLGKRLRCPAILYALAVIYSYEETELKMSKSRVMLEEILRDPEAMNYHDKAKFMLAHNYRSLNDLDSCALVIDSISEPKDLELRDIWIIWNANVCRFRKEFERGERLLTELLDRTSPKQNWYTYFSAKLILGLLLVDQRKFDEAAKTIQEIKQLFAGKVFKAVQSQIEGFEETLRKSSDWGTLQVLLGKEESILSYSSKSMKLKRGSTSERLVRLFLQKRHIDKASIMESIYSKTYGGVPDDRVIHSHIHSLRKQLESLGLPSGAIQREGDYYRLMPTAERLTA